MLADCHESLLQRVVDRCDASDLFLLRLVCKRFRDAVAQRVRRVEQDERGEVPSDLALTFPRLTSLDVQNIPCCDPWLGPALAQLPDLHELLNLNFLHNTIPEQSLQGLTWLSLIEVEDGAKLNSLAAACTSLQRLDLHICELEFEDLCTAVAHLAGTLTHLELDLTGREMEIPQQCLQTLNTGRLQRLKLMMDSRPGLSAGAWQELAAFTSLLSLDINVADDMEMPHLTALTRLTSLSLCKTYVTAAGLKQLTTLTKLAALDLHCYLGTTSSNAKARAAQHLPAALACFPGLTDLDISGCQCPDICRSLSALTRLTRLEALECEILLQSLPCLPRLRALEIAASVEHESQLRHLSGLCGLTQLGLECTHSGWLDLSEAGARWLAALPELQHLCLFRCTLTQGALEQLPQLPLLRALDLVWAELSPACDLRPLESLRLERLRLPWQLEAADQLPLGLRVAVIKGRRWEGRPWGVIWD